MRGAFLVGVAVLAMAIGGCRSRGGAPAAGAPAAGGAACAEPDMPTVTRVLAGDTLHGRLACDQGCQCFYFEGVAYTAFDWEFSGVEKSCAVEISITDPDGQPLPLPNARKGSGYILRKTGLYRGTVCKGVGAETMYAFRYDLRALPPESEKLWLAPETRKDITVHVPRGSNVLVTMQPTHDCNVVPMVYKVKGPDGKSALGPEVLEGACPAMVFDGRSNNRRLRFNAAQPGRYVITVASEAGTEGEATVGTQVFQPKQADRELYHDNAPCPEPCAPTQVAASR